MELVGRPAEITPAEDGRFQVAFHCCNGEVFHLWIPQALLSDFERGKVFRVWTHYINDENGMPSNEAVIEHWESLE